MAIIRIHGRKKTYVFKINSIIWVINTWYEGIYLRLRQNVLQKKNVKLSFPWILCCQSSGTNGFNLLSNIGWIHIYEAIFYFVHNLYS